MTLSTKRWSLPGRRKRLTLDPVSNSDLPENRESTDDATFFQVMAKMQMIPGVSSQSNLPAEEGMPDSGEMEV